MTALMEPSLLGIASNKRGQEGLNEAHRQNASRDRRASKQQRCGLQCHKTAQKRRDRGKDTYRMCRYGPPARLTADPAPRAEPRLAHQAHRGATAVRAFDHYASPNGWRLSGARRSPPDDERSPETDFSRSAARVRCSRGLGALCHSSTSSIPRARQSTAAPKPEKLRHSLPF